MDMSLFYVALMSAIVNFLCFGGNWLFGQPMTDLPIIVGPLLGWLLGDLETGLILGASLQAIFMGAVNVGGAVSLNPSFATTLAVAFAIYGGAGGNDAVIALAIPLGLLGGMLEVAANTIFSFLGARFDKAAEENNQKQIVRLHFGGWFFKFLLIAVVVFFSVYAGANLVTSFINSLPDFVLNGLGVVSGLLPAVGFAMLLSMIWSNEIAIFYFVGFVLVAYMNLPLLAVAIFGLLFAITYMFIVSTQKANNNQSENYDSSLSEEEEFLS